MKNRNIMMIIAALCVLSMSACFSSWDGSDEQGNIVISLGDGGARYVVPGGPGGETEETEETEETAALEYTIILTSPGKASQSGKLSGNTSAEFSVQPGLWTVVVRMENADAFKYGETDVEVKAGDIVSAPITLISPTQFTDWDGLESSITDSDGKDQVFLLKENLTVNKKPIEINSGRNITLLAKTPVEIIKGEDIDNSLFRVIWGSKLTLGGIDEGTITIVGNEASNNSSLFYVGTTTVTDGLTGPGTGGTLIINDGVTLTNNHVTMDNRGGAIVVQGGTLIMNGGIISKNSANNFGGGVRVLSGTFTKTGGTIYGSNSGDNSNTATNGGHAVYYDTTKKSINTTLGPNDNLY